MNMIRAILTLFAVIIVGCGEQEVMDGETADTTPRFSASERSTITPTVNPADVVTPVVSPSIQELTPSPFQSPQPSPLISTAGSLHLDRNFENLSDLAGASDIIVVATVISTEQRPFGGLPFTASSLLVEDVLRGDIVVGDALSIIEMGGAFTPSDKDGSGGEGLIETTFAGVPPVRTGETWLLFLSQVETGELAQGARSVLNGFQGKYNIADDGFIRFTGARETLDEPCFELSASTDGRDAAGVIEQVRGISAR